MADVDASLVVAPHELKKLVYSQNLIERNRINLDIRERVYRIYFFSTWFNSNCSLVVSSGYRITLVLYERSYNNIPETFEVVRFSETYSSVSEVKDKLCDLEAKLNSANPILCKSNKLDLSYDKKYLS